MLTILYAMLTNSVTWAFFLGYQSC